MPSYLLRVVEDYLRYRRITYDFWNGLYDSLLRLDLPRDVDLVAYADDVAAVIVERSPELAQLKLN